MAKASAKRRSGETRSAQNGARRSRPRNKLALSWLLERRRREDARKRPVSVRVWALLATGTIAAVAGITLWLGGFADDAYRVAKGSARVALIEAGFTLEHIEVRGAREAEAEEVAAILAVNPGTLIFDFDLEAARGRVEALGWVDHAVVLRLLPNRVVVMIDERQPLALWGSPEGVVVLDAAGETVRGADPSAFDGLTRLEGVGAPAAAGELVQALSRRPALARQVDSVERVGGRRWDLKLLSGVVVRIPEGGVESALEELTRLDAEGGVLALPLEMLDLRSGDVVMRPRAQPGRGLGHVFERGA